MANYGPPILDFSWLGQAGDTLGNAFKQRRDTDALLAAYDASQGQPQGIAAVGQPAPPVAPQAPSTLSSLGRGDYFSRTASAESSNDPNARNPKSSATGLHQFLSGTWNGLMKSNPELGLTADGRTDPEQSNRAMRAFTAQNADALKAKGIQPTDGNLYMAHFLGAGAAPNFINAVQQDPTVPAASLVRPEVVAANRGVFLNPDGSPKSAGEVYQRMTGRFGNGSTAVAALSGGQGAPVQVAQAPGGPQADLPAQGAANAEGFAIPQGAQPATRQNVNGQMIRSLLANPGTRDIGKQLWAQTLGGKQYGFQVVGDQLYRTDPRTGSIEPVGVSKPVQPVTVSPGQRLVDPRTGQVVYQGANDSFRNLVTAEERSAAGIQPDDKRPYQMGPDGKLTSPGGTTVNNQIKNEGTIPAGFKAVRDSTGNVERLEAIPGSEAAQKAEAQTEKDKQQKAMLAQTGMSVFSALDDIDRTSASSRFPVAGGMAGALANIPGTGAHNVAQSLNTIRANISFERLNQMRQASPTGGALGAVSDSEQRLLSNSLAALEQSQDSKQFNTNLKRVRAAFEKVVNGKVLTTEERAASVKAREDELRGEEAPKGNAPPKRGELVDGYRYKGGDPADPKSWVKVQ